jgi:hypothetical protein
VGVGEAGDPFSGGGESDAVAGLAGPRSCTVEWQAEPI